MIINLLFAVVLGGGGWLIGVIWASVNEARDKTIEVSLELARNYVPRVEMQRVVDSIDKKLDEIQKMLRGTGA